MQRERQHHTLNFHLQVDQAVQKDLLDQEDLAGLFQGVLLVLDFQ